MDWLLYDIGLRHERVKQFLIHTVISCKRVLIWELEWDYKRHEIIKEIRTIRNHDYSYFFTHLSLRLYEAGTFFISLGIGGSRLSKVGFRHKLGQYFPCKYIRPRRKNVPPQHFFYKCNYKKRFCLFNTLNETANQSLLKKHSLSQSLWVY